MATLSGKTGQVSFNSALMLRVTGWSATENVLVEAYASNATNGVKQRVAGVKDFTATVRALYDATIVPTIGQIAVLLLVIKTSSPIVTFSSTSAIVENVEVEVDVDTGAPVSYVLTFSGNGAALTETYSP